MSDLPQQLKTFLQGAQRIAVLAIGSDLRGDDAAGMLVGQELSRAKPSPHGPVLEVFFGGDAPENLTGQIKRFAPTHLIIVDAADLRLAPGQAQVIDEKALASLGNASMSTHAMPITVLISYLQTFVKCRALVIGIQPASCAFGAPVSEAVRKGSQDVAQVILSAVRLP